MISRALSALAILVFVTSCDKPDDVVVTETRRLTLRDGKPQLFASSDERFSNTRPSPVIGQPPTNWLSIPGTEFRLLNYRFGNGGEVSVSVARGGVLGNVNRWLRQFGQDGLDEAGLKKLRKVPMAGGEGVWIEA